MYFILKGAGMYFFRLTRKIWKDKRNYTSFEMRKNISERERERECVCVCVWVRKISKSPSEIRKLFVSLSLNNKSLLHFRIRSFYRGWGIIQVIISAAVVIHEALGFNLAQGWMNRAPNETRSRYILNENIFPFFTSSANLTY